MNILFEGVYQTSIVDRYSGINIADYYWHQSMLNNHLEAAIKNCQILLNEAENKQTSLCDPLDEFNQLGEFNYE